jgi:hypothetical protein
MKPIITYFIIYFFLFLVLFFHSSCHKRCKAPIKYNIDQGTNMLFANGGNGSWWVFEEEKSLLRDSIYLTSHSATVEHNEKQCIDNDVETINYTGQNIFFSNADTKIYAQGQNNSEKRWDIVSTNCNAGKTFSYSLNRISDGSFEKSIWLDYEILSVDTILGNSYNNVLKFYIKDHYDNSSNTITYRILHFAPSIGLIKCENIPNSRHPDSTVYNLVKYHIQ